MRLNDIRIGAGNGACVGCGLHHGSQLAQAACARLQAATTDAEEREAWRELRDAVEQDVVRRQGGAPAAEQLV